MAPWLGWSISRNKESLGQGGSKARPRSWGMSLIPRPLPITRDFLSLKMQSVFLVYLEGSLYPCIILLEKRRDLMPTQQVGVRSVPQTMGQTWQLSPCPRPLILK
jgi:hypothetical protein